LRVTSRGLGDVYKRQDMTSGFILNVDGSQITCPQQSKDTLADLLLDQALIKLG
jgi:hypothetical protein